MKKLLLIIGYLLCANLLLAQETILPLPPWYHKEFQYNPTVIDTTKVELEPMSVHRSSGLDSIRELLSIPYAKPIIQQFYVDELPLHEFLILAALKDWSLYKQECYNDSVIISYRYVVFDSYGNYRTLNYCMSPESFKNMLGDYLSCEPIVWRVTPTFEGFIEYMEKKYKR